MQGEKKESNKERQRYIEREKKLKKDGESERTVEVKKDRDRWRLIKS